MAIDKITTPAVTDDSVTLAKMAPGTDGNIISYDASGNPVAIATGNDGQVLTSTGAGSPPAFETLPVGGTNTPSFFAYLGSNQNISTATHTTVALNTEAFDTANGFDTSTHKYTIPSGQGGKYLITAGVRRENFNPPRFTPYILKNNSVGLWNAENSGTDSGAYYESAQGSSIVSLSAGDVIHLVVYHTNGSTKAIMSGIGNTYFGAFKLIE